MLALSWNVRGFGRREKWRAVRKSVYLLKLVMLFIQESKLGVFDNSVVRSLGGSLLTRGVGVKAEGSAGGLISLWNDDLFKVHSCISCKRCIILAGELTSLNKQVFFVMFMRPILKTKEDCRGILS
ncbi:hypothetical protein Dsin_016681 [Dipteronia sinensis]|uniref:Uncharacterized protein n=1 Tax=Dipteronia sinensis TaxID=43782 RepID=A0AAE0AEZ5_9ROSI|nr:hypothetical protein Dsin_016681 [Dipteronia sinensis]